MKFDPRSLTAAALLAGLTALAPTLRAQEEQPAPKEGEPEIIEEAAAESSSPFTFSIGTDITTHYFFRGILQENQDYIVQPYGSVTIGLWEGDGAINSVSAVFGTWHSLHGGPSGEDGASPIEGAWYEADLYGGVSVGAFENFTFSATYTAYLAPDKAFDTIQDIAFGVSYNDAAWWGDSGFSLAPSFTTVVEIDNEADQGNTVTGITGSEEGVYFQLGLKPSFVAIQSEEYPVTLSFPLVVGLGKDYYEIDSNGDGAIDDDDTFGYFSAGVFASVPLGFLPGDAWTLTVGANFMFLGDTAEFMNVGESFEVVGTAGLSFAF